MVRMYCRRHHGHAQSTPCSECASLLAYASRRTERCVFGDAKPTCANCLVHCYTQVMRERVKAVMRWAGPRMLLRHPILAVRHKLDGLKPAPLLPVVSKVRAPD
jgi:Nitrous oxide-stimulated promoter